MADVTEEDAEGGREVHHVGQAEALDLCVAVGRRLLYLHSLGMFWGLSKIA